MSLTKEDLQAIQLLLQPLKEGQEALQADVSELKADVAELKTTVARLETDVDTLKTDVAGLKTDVAELKTDVAGLETSYDRLSQSVAVIEVDHGAKLSVLFDAHMDNERKAATSEIFSEALKTKVDNHDHRIFALELAVRNR